MRRRGRRRDAHALLRVPGLQCSQRYTVETPREGLGLGPDEDAEDADPSISTSTTSPSCSGADSGRVPVKTASPGSQGHAARLM